MIFPMYAMVVLTLIVLVAMFLGRVRAVRERKVHPKAFGTGAAGDFPEYALLPARHFANLFELPVLFYAACLTAMQMQAAGPTMTVLAWVFVASRYAHAFIHIGYNKLYPRMAAFAIGVIAVFAMWTLMMLAVA